jgi:hypothetical protein
MTNKTLDKRLEKLAKEAENLSNLYSGYWRNGRILEGNVAVEVQENLSLKQYFELCDYLVQQSFIVEVWKEDKDGEVWGYDSPVVLIDCSDEEQDKIVKNWKENKDKAPYSYIKDVKRLDYGEMSVVLL